MRPAPGARLTGRALSRPERPLEVLDHRFGAGEPLTVGVEEEYMLLDAETLALAQRAESILRAEERGDFAELVSSELFESLVEFHTPVCRTIPEVGRELRRLRAPRGRIGRGAGAAARQRRHASVQPLRAAARHER